VLVTQLRYSRGASVSIFSRFRWDLLHFLGGEKKREKPFPVNRTDLNIVVKWCYN